MFGRIQSGLFGRRERAIAPAPQQQDRPPSPYPLPLGPPAPERELPLHGQWIGELQGPQYVAPYHHRYYPRGRQIGQAHENIFAVRKAFPPKKDVVIYSPDDPVTSAGFIIPSIGEEKKSNEERNARRIYKKIRAQRYANGGSIKSYGIGSSCIKETGRAACDPSATAHEVVTVAKSGGKSLAAVRSGLAEARARYPPPQRARPGQVIPRR